MGYRVEVRYRKERQIMRMHVSRIDPEVGGRIWYSDVNLFGRDAAAVPNHAYLNMEPQKIEENPERQIWVEIVNGYAEPDREIVVPGETPSTYFSYPAFYKNIVDNVGIFNALPCSGRRRIVREENVPEVLSAISDRTRQFPIVLVISRETQDGMMDEDWLAQFRVSDFTRTVWRYAHVLCTYEAVGRDLLRQFGDVRYNSEPQIPRLYIFWPDGSHDDYGSDDVENCAFGRHLEARGDARTYDIVHGGQAFYHKIVTDLRDWNISANLWEGFQLNVMTGIPED